MADSPTSAPLSRGRRLAGAAGLVVTAGLALAPWATADPSPEFPSDERGFVGTAAYCQGAAEAEAFGRTKDALVAICSGPDGQLQYRGVRLEDDAALMLDAAAAGAGGFSAENEDVVYWVTATELVVTSGDTTLHRQPMIEYRAP
ncbi:hypothetical protein [Mycolicibacterium litorale]|uniref:Serine/threonine protein kinase n=1 Tax=Mycolicibacterium litorale TaxID=758802 RepID=A0AAD1MTB3_9MYCO|nr:hypothetical protein [Mycolicibacterium litorale]MCV7414850.1 hypothetical protein [Mycolicibacterium litorale]TDY08097.1 hypothetical protein BCL50_0159 [Mycolicibacterium litorale]BBY16018.1 hypothetical protein MLIT_16100 [Mycolicibacterium litorale]